MILVMLAVNSDHGNFESQIRALQFDGSECELDLVGDPIPCRFERAFRTWHAGMPGRHEILHRDRYVTLQNGLFVIGEPKHEYALPCADRVRNVGNLYWDGVWVDDRHIGDLVAIIAYLHAQHWTCEAAEVPLMDVWDNADWTGMQYLVGGICEPDEHVTTI